MSDENKEVHLEQAVDVPVETPEFDEPVDLNESIDHDVLNNPDNFVEQPAVWQGTLAQGLLDAAEGKDTILMGNSMKSTAEDHVVSKQISTDPATGQQYEVTYPILGVESVKPIIGTMPDQGLVHVPQILPESTEESVWLDLIKSGMYLPMQVIHPSSKPLSPEYQQIVDRLLLFFNRINPNAQEMWGTKVDPAIFMYQGFVCDEEARWIRFQLGDKCQSFVVPEVNFNKFIASIREDFDMTWILSSNGREDWQKKGYHLNVSKASIELPLSYFFVPPGKREMDDLVDGDFRDLHSLVERLKRKVAENLRDITVKSLGLVNFPYKRDHDMYLAFKARDKDMQVLDVSMEKVYPLLPESGEVSIGDHPINLFEWNHDKKSLVTAKQIQNLVKQTNREIEKVRGLINQHPIIQEAFKQEVKTIMYAATHFTKKLYGCNPDDVQDQVMKVTNDVVRALTNKGGKIGLDLNSWIVWQYHDDKAPTKATDPELDFVGQILNRYTDSFVEALYAYLLNLGNPYIKPYDYRVKADATDGIELGSIRRV